MWERGNGEVFSSPEGACAAVIAGVLNGWCARDVVVHNRSGDDLRVIWEGQDDTGNVWLVGNATEIETDEVNLTESSPEKVGIKTLKKPRSKSPAKP